MIELLEDDSVTEPTPLIIWTQGHRRLEVRSVHGVRLVVLVDRGIEVGVWGLPSRAKPS